MVRLSPAELQDAGNIAFDTSLETIEAELEKVAALGRDLVVVSPPGAASASRGCAGSLMPPPSSPGSGIGCPERTAADPQTPPSARQRQRPLAFLMASFLARGGFADINGRHKLCRGVLTLILRPFRLRLSGNRSTVFLEHVLRGVDPARAAWTCIVENICSAWACSCIYIFEYCHEAVFTKNPGQHPATSDFTPAMPWYALICALPNMWLILLLCVRARFC